MSQLAMGLGHFFLLIFQRCYSKVRLDGKKKTKSVYTF